MLNNINEKKQLNIIQENNQRRIEEQEKEATGKKINSASDNPAGLAISEALWAQIDGLEVATRNTYDGVNMLNTAEGGMSVISDSLQHIRDLTVQASNGIYGQFERNIIGNEIKQTLKGISDIAKNTEFNGKPLLDGSNGQLNLQTGANSGDLTGVNIADMGLDALGLSSFEELDFGNMTSEDFSELLGAIDSAMDYVSSGRASIGAMQNGLDHLTNSNSITSENLQKGASRITDTDMAKQAIQAASRRALSDVNIALQAQQAQSAEISMQLLMP